MAGEDDAIGGRLRVALELRRVREAQALTQAEAASRVRWSASKVARIEAGQVAVSSTDLRALLTVYKVTGADRRELLEANDSSRRSRVWWKRYTRFLTPPLQQLLRYESQCQLMRQFEPHLVPGLLQTRAYAREVLSQHAADPATVEALVKVRLRRQVDVCQRSSPPRVWFYLDEAAVRRVIGSPRLMVDQIEHILETADKPHVEVGIIPFDVGVHPGLRGPLVLYGLQDAHGGYVVYQESWTGGAFTREEPVVDQTRAVFGKLATVALPAKESAAFLRRALAEFRTKAEAAERAKAAEAAKAAGWGTPEGWSDRP